MVVRYVPMIRIAFAAAALTLAAAPAFAQSGDDTTAGREPWRYRVAAGPQLTPKYPGSDGHVVRPLVDISRARGDTPFEFEAADESFAIPLIQTDSFAFGPAANIEGSRRRKEVGANIDEVGTSVELGGFADLWLGQSFRAHAELRQGVTGHKGLVSNIGVDAIARDGDKWLVSLGPRVSLADNKFKDAYFRVTPREAAATGLAVYDPSGFGVYAVGASATAIYQFTDRWGVYGYAKYDRLIDDAGRSPIVRQLGSRDQLSGGLALTFTFGGNR
jgi:MipA family protein